MKISRKFLLLSGFFLAAYMVARPVRAGFVPPSPDELATSHLQTAELLEEKANGYDAMIAEHQNMIKNSSGMYYLKATTPPNGVLAPMAEHCQGIIDNAAKLRDEFRQLAKWHRGRATELEGK